MECFMTSFPRQEHESFDRYVGHIHTVTIITNSQGLGIYLPAIKIHFSLYLNMLLTNTVGSFWRTLCIPRFNVYLTCFITATQILSQLYIYTEFYLRLTYVQSTIAFQTPTVTINL